MMITRFPRTIQELGLFIIRVGMGIIFIMHGFPKLAAGVEKWTMLGSAMQNFGITFAPALWGFAAACAEFFGGIALMLGVGTRIAALMIGSVMLVAVVFHLGKGDGFSGYAHALSLLIVMVGLAVAHD